MEVWGVEEGGCGEVAVQLVVVGEPVTHNRFLAQINRLAEHHSLTCLPLTTKVPHPDHQEVQDDLQTPYIINHPQKTYNVEVVIVTVYFAHSQKGIVCGEGDSAK